MRNISILLLAISLCLPMSTHAFVPVAFADASSSIFRFQIKLAEQGNAEAQYKVGEMYELGKGIAKDGIKAREWYTKADKQGHKKAAYKLLFLDIQASGVTNDSKLKLGQLRKEANAGAGDAQYFLGKMYASGVGVSKSYQQAQSWLSKATFNGISEAETELIAVEEEIARIEARNAQRKAEAEKKRKEKEAAEKAKKEREAKKARERELAKKREAEKRAAARREAERKRQQQAAAAAAAKERKQQASKPAPAPAPKKEDTPEVDENAVFESDPCKGKKAKFLSICK